MIEIEILKPYPALLLSEKTRRYLIISDLHIGFEEVYAEAGINIHGSIELIAETLFALLEDKKPNQLVILGDVKQSIGKIGRFEWREIPRFLEEVAKRVQVTIIPGNHDGSLSHLLPRNIELCDKSGLLIGRTGLIHGHTKLPVEFLSARRIIMGHIHPKYNRSGSPLSGQQVWLLMKTRKNLLYNEAKATELEIYVVPSFNRELTWSGFTRRGRIISPIVRRIREEVQEAIIMTVDGDIIGGLESLEYVL